MEKKNVLIIGLLAVGLILIAQLFNLQILKDEYKITAENNAFKYITRYPVRGLILDRNGNILVGNKNTYDITVTPYEVTEFDTVDFCSIFELDINMVKEKFAEYKKYSFWFVTITIEGYSFLIYDMSEEWSGSM